MRGTIVARGAPLLGAAAALVACNSIFGIEALPDDTSDASGALDGNVDVTTGPEAGPGPEAAAEASPGDATMLEAGGDVGTPPPSDAGPDVIDAEPDSPVHHCVPPCTVGTAQCVAGGLQSCTLVNGCPTWSAPVACPAGESCWGAGVSSYCCAGGAAACAPSCHTIPGGGGDAGDGQTNCGRSGADACCATLPVTGGSYLRSYDAVFNTDATNPATVSTFVLDKYEVTVGRFRTFVKAWTDSQAPWRPAQGSGIHTHLNGGQGLRDVSQASTYEPGWQAAAWNTILPTTEVDWDADLGCDGARDTWTSSPGANEALPVNCVDWTMAYAFCIWDGGFLPSETEWDYAAAGGGASDGQRVYAWSSPPTSTTIDCTFANYQACGGALDVVGIDTKGYGKWGHADLTGSLWEWTLDYRATYVSPCTDCVFLGSSAGGRSIRGASFNYPANQLYVGTRVGDDPTVRYSDDGFRCARAP